MRIVNAMFGRRRGGLEQVCVDYCEALTQAGHEVHALIHPKAAIRADLEARNIAIEATANLGAWDAIAMLRLRGWLNRLAPDVTIAHGNRAASLLKGAGMRPLVGVAQNYLLKCHGLDAVLCATGDLRRHCGEQGVAADRLFVIPNAVRAPVLAPQRPWHDPPVIGAMGRFVTKKGFDVLLDALRLLAAEGVSFRAVLGGDGAEDAALKARARQSGLGDIVEFPGWLADKPGFFAAIDVFCLPSLHEPFGIVLLEALAHAVPAITTDAEGPLEIVTPGDDGVIVPKGDPAALAAAIARLLNDRETAHRLGRAGYETILRGYDLPIQGKRLDAALRAIVAR
jgi:glycosyltransferase involved in cell wall biosynthesis